MAFTVTINYGSGNVALTNYSGQNLVYAGSLKKTTQVHSKDFRPVSGQAWFSIQPKPALMSALFALDRDQLITVSIMDGATPWFTGYVRPLTKFKDSTGKTSVDFECVDAGWPLHLKPSVDVQYVPADNMVVCNTSTTSVSLIHQLLIDAGFTGSVSAFNIAESIGYLRVVNKPFFEVLSDLCFSYHASFYFDDAGGFVLYDWGKTSGSISSSGTVDEDNMLGELSIDRSTDIPDTPIVIYMEQSSQAGVDLGSLAPSPVVIADSTDISTHGTPMVWNGRTGSKGLVDFVNTRTFIVSHKPAPENFDGIISTSVTLTRIQGSNFVNDTPYDRIDLAGGRYLKTFPLTTTPTVVTWNLRDVITVSGTFTKTTATWAYNNAVNDGICNRIEKVAVSGNCAVSIEAGRVTGPAIGSGTKDYTARYLYDETLAETLATAISENLRYGEYKYSWRSVENLTVGNYYTVANTLASVSSLVRVTKKTININPSGYIFYEYEGTRYSGFATVTVAADPGYQSEVIIVEEDEDTQVIEGPEMPEAADISLSATGLYLTKDKMGYYDASAADWKAVINNDGTFKFDGDGSSFIEWDGSSLSIAGDLALSGSSTIQGTIISGNGVVSSNFETGVSGWSINGNGEAEFETVVIREIDSSMLISGNLTVTGDLQLPAGYIYGLETTPGADTDHDVTIAPGKCRSYADTYDLIKTSAITKQIDAAWTAGTNAGGNMIGSLFGNSTVTSGGTDATYNDLAFDSSGNIIATNAGTVTVHSGMTGSVTNTFALGVSPIHIDVDKTTGNLITGVSSNVYRYSGMSNSLSTSFTVGHGIGGLAVTPSGNLVTLNSAGGTYGQINIYSGISATVTSTISILSSIGSSRGIKCSDWGTYFICDETSDNIIEVSANGEILNRIPGPGASVKHASYFNGTLAIKQTSTTVSLYSQPWANYTYHKHLIRKDSDGSIDAGFDATVDCRNIPSGYTAYRRIRSYMTDASANIIQTVQNGDEFDFLSSQSVLNTTGSTPPSTGTEYSCGVPSGMNLLTRFLAYLAITSTNEGLRLNCPELGITSPEIVRVIGGSILYDRGSYSQWTDTSGQITVAGSTGSVNIDNCIVSALSWTDTRGRFGGV
jgi:hypothetical protein